MVSFSIIYYEYLLSGGPTMVGHVELVKHSVRDAASELPDRRPFRTDKHVVQQALWTILEGIVLVHEPQNFLIGPEWDILGDIVHASCVARSYFLSSLKKKHIFLI